MLARLEALHQQGFLTDLDLHFARFLARLAGSPAPELVLGACLASHGTGQGNVCVNLPALAGRPVLGSAEEALLAPEAGVWIAALRASPLVGSPGEFRPLVLDHQGRLYLYRYWDYERQLAEDLLARAATDPEDVDEQRLRDGLNELFPKPPDGMTDWQKIAAAAAVLKRVCVISGGPGTGKTTTVLRILALLAQQSKDRPPRIGLAAPTGKAAARLQEAIRLAKQSLPLEETVRDNIPEAAATLHRLLGARPDSPYFRHDRKNPLPLDVLVVDEASMVDLALMAKLVAALPAKARLILLGDKDQLASVEAGAVLGDICGNSGGFAGAFRERLASVTGETILAGGSGPSPLENSIVLLRYSYRFGGESGIGHLARAVNAGQAGEALGLLAGGRFADLRWQPIEAPRELAGRLAGSVVAGFRAYLEGVRAKVDAAELFAAFNRFRVLCAHRRGPAGVERLNPLIEEILRRERLLSTRQLWYPGRPVLITRNDYHLRLFNGDVGLALPDTDGRLRVFFQTSDGSLRRFPPTRLPEHETVYAMTVHKSQGSEFEEVLLALPFEDSPVLTRELLYTGITRAKTAVEIWGSARVLETAVRRALRRSSGLREALWGEVGGVRNEG